MKTFIAFFITLFALFTIGENAICYTSTGNLIATFNVQKVSSNFKLETNFKTQLNTKISKPNLIDFLNDDDDISLSRRYLPQAKYFVIFSIIAILGLALIDNKSIKIPFWQNYAITSSPKYIFQRVIRI